MEGMAPPVTIPTQAPARFDLGSVVPFAYAEPGLTRVTGPLIGSHLIYIRQKQMSKHISNIADVIIPLSQFMSGVGVPRHPA